MLHERGVLMTTSYMTLQSFIYHRAAKLSISKSSTHISKFGFLIIINLDPIFTFFIAFITIIIIIIKKLSTSIDFFYD